MVKSKNKQERLAYIFYEGFTEEIFYKKVFRNYLNGIPNKTKNLESGTGINKEIANELYYFFSNKKNKNIDLYVYAFIDREGTKNDLVEFDADAILKVLNKKQIKKIEKIEAIIMIESWFFYDLEGICNYIGLKLTDSLRRTYSNPERLTHKDLQGLFRKGTKRQHYIKGEKGFLEKLSIGKIYGNCTDLKTGIQMIRKDFKKT
ncbi:MAG: hypothetical protein ABF633_07070 [Clostridium sp.]|uniref:hypothetical protein n=1 Tax=Clostridium sp. TaxID=1506 RepID=UPI0039EB3CB9